CVDSSQCLFQFYFFFFQAEDGIRDSSVTGVQTCALPISLEEVLQVMIRAPAPFITCRTFSRVAIVVSPGVVMASAPCAAPHSTRSEERRVGKECRCRRSTCP